MRYWLVKTEPEAYSWDQLVSERQGCWDGVRNLEARNNLRQMSLNDLVFIYHSGRQRQVVGLSQCVRSAYRDPTSTRAIWSAVDLSPIKPLVRPVPLAEIKQDDSLTTCPLCRRARLSVMELTREHFERIMELGKTSL